MEEIKTGQHIATDYFTCTFDLPIIDKDEEKLIVDDKVEEFKSFLNIEEILPARKDRYKYSYKLAEGIQINLVGPKSHGIPTMNIEFKGEGCREFERLNPDKSWCDFFYYMLITKQGRPSRLDIAFDDFDGTLCPFEWVRDKLDKGYFTTLFKDKEYIITGSKSKGYSINYGSKKGPKALTIYQKNLQKKMKDIYWTRFEMRYYHNDAINTSHDLLNALMGKHKDIAASGDEAFKIFGIGLLLSMLDIKEDNNYDSNHQYMVKRDSKWEEFTSNPTKIKISKANARPRIWPNYSNYCKNLLVNYITVSILKNNKNYYQFTTEILKETLDKLETFNPLKLNQLNKYLKENNCEELTNAGFEQFKLDLKNEIEVERRLPF